MQEAGRDQVGESQKPYIVTVPNDRTTSSSDSFFTVRQLLQRRLDLGNIQILPRE